MTARDALLNNPFARLDADITDKRARLIELSEEAALFGDGDAERDLNRLIQPNLRLDAELNWFPGTDRAEVKRVLDYARADDRAAAPDFHTESRLARFNAVRLFLCDWPVADQGDAMALCLSLMPLDRALTAEAVRGEIQRDRARAGFSGEIDDQALSAGLNALRDAACETALSKMAALSDRDRSTLLTGLAKLYGSPDPAFHLCPFIERLIRAYERAEAGTINAAREALRQSMAAMKDAGISDRLEAARRFREALERWSEAFAPVHALHVSRHAIPDGDKNLLYDVLNLCVQMVSRTASTREVKVEMGRALDGLIALSEGMDHLNGAARTRRKALP